MHKDHWHAVKSEEVLKRFESSKRGLIEKEAQARLKKIGPNQLEKAKPFSYFKIFLSQFKNPLVYLLIVAALIALFLSKFTDFFVILAAVLLNTLLGFFQEAKVERALLKLKKLIKPFSKVIREGKERLIETKNLVPGDILVLESGDKVGADARILEAHNLSVNEAILTGESIPSSKNPSALAVGCVLAEREDMVFQGTNIERGRGLALIVATGYQTEFGRIAKLVSETEKEQTPLQQKLNSLAKTIGFVVLGLCTLIFILGILSNKTFFEMFYLSTAVMVGAVPEALVIAVTISLTIGMYKILKKNALVKKLIATETLGSVSVICSDKTGTLTEGRMMVDHISTYSNSPESHELALRVGLLCNNAKIENPEDELKDWRIIGDSTEKALLLAAVSAGLQKQAEGRSFPRIDELPFDEIQKFMATLHKDLSLKGRSLKNILYLKGAPEKILEKSMHVLADHQKKIKITKAKKQEFLHQIDRLASKGLRVLAVAYKKTEIKTINEEETNGLILLGFIAIKDPLRKEVKAAIEQCRSAGIRPIIITGDHKFTALAIANELGLRPKKNNILEGSELDQIKEEDFEKKITQISVYPRTEPRHKLRIIRAWQKKGEVVAVTGDGVNDAPAIKGADIGIALGSGSDVTKEVADLVLLDNNFKTIVEAVRQGRLIFKNIKKIIVYLLGDAATEIILILGSLILKLPFPLFPVQILWINLIEDALPALALSYEQQDEKGIMNFKPEKKTSLLDPEMKFIIFFIAITTDILLLVLFAWFFKQGWELNKLRTFIFAGATIETLAYVFSCRSLQKPIWKMNPFSNRFLNFSVLFGLVMLVIGIYHPFFQKILNSVALGIHELGLLVLVALFSVSGIEITKFVFSKRKERC